MRKSKNQSSKIVYLIITFSFFVIANWYLSDLIVTNLRRGWFFSSKLLDFVYVKNTGAAFNLLNNETWFLIGFSLLAVVVLFAYIIKHSKTMSYNGIFWLSLLLSGIFCNLYERVSYGYVRDFFELKFIDFPVFNISDVCIIVGVCAIIFLLLKRTQLKQL